MLLKGLWSSFCGLVFFIFNGVFNNVALFIVNIYKYIVSPFLGANCRYTPTCSCYAYDCYKKFNFFFATFLTLKRIAKCNPFGGSGYDPLPDFKKKSEIKHEKQV